MKRIVTIFLILVPLFCFSQRELINHDFKRMMNAPRSILKPFNVNSYYCMEFSSSITCVTNFEHKQFVEMKFFKTIPHYIFTYFRGGKARRLKYYDYSGNSSEINANLVDFLIDVVEIDLYKEKKYGRSNR